MADVLKSIMNKITDDDPATRGQQLWVMFTLAIFLVAVLNYYAMVREPDIVEMEDLIEYKNEVVKVEGEIISWREDPWNSGDWETHVIVSDGPAVVEARWSRPAEIPPKVQCQSWKGRARSSAVQGIFQVFWALGCCL